MGWCQEFGSSIAVGCDHPMTAAVDHCTCEVCGTVCNGRFNACASVWANVSLAPAAVRVEPPDGSRPSAVTRPPFRSNGKHALTSSEATERPEGELARLYELVEAQSALIADLSRQLSELRQQLGPQESEDHAAKVPPALRVER